MAKLKANQRELQAEISAAWDAQIQELLEDTQKIRKALEEQHLAEREMLDSKIRKISEPKAKFSPGILNSKYIFEQLLRRKDYGRAREVRDQVLGEQEVKIGLVQSQFENNLEKHRALLIAKQKNEFEALNAKLELSVKLKQKTAESELQRLAQKFKNAEAAMRQKQDISFAKFISQQLKWLLKSTDNSEEERNGRADAGRLKLSVRAKTVEQSSRVESSLKVGNFSCFLNSSLKGDCDAVKNPGGGYNVKPARARCYVQSVEKMPCEKKERRPPRCQPAAQLSDNKENCGSGFQESESQLLVKPVAQPLLVSKTELSGANSAAPEPLPKRNKTMRKMLEERRRNRLQSAF